MVILWGPSGTSTATKPKLGVPSACVSTVDCVTPSTCTSNGPPGGHLRYQASRWLTFVPMGAVDGAVFTQVAAPVCLLCATMRPGPYHGSSAGVGCVVTV